ncbi:MULTISPECIES: HAD family hydrolase [unclassified Micromonospora]|uniref:HAD family hydrolase n=1 Tax=unclassified Micromonospora TaxID=2617518 RepID=UPI00112E9625|nr:MULTISPECIES: haloacid dehalogenase-like hydrolase [unclassified Micromonospora]MCK1809123.1 haloacid dehalogenase-like hydrolase [Micromonospora sp. R42106]MCK1833733.1 haloacid dehalogenase-like hydrolase [Micromonospora sp. R42003]MCK1845708.1 haloacid dehalogenase-like hydrolase [Micromonospora sp. R42004]MCM1017209.1 haloacid dehalogenase-like hydrolase [Micromonospora sp. XM-20-01]
MPPLMVGFDLDMTLVDSRPGIAAAFRALTTRTGVHVDGDLAVSRLGPPLRTELAHWFPPERIEEAVTLYRELYPAYAITPTVPMPGAEAALRAVQARGGRTMVVTAKIGRLAKLHLDHLGLPVDELAGDVFAEQKAVALREHGATLYVGDHVADMAAARAAGIPGVAVATGPCSVDELTEAGAYLVLDDLVEFPRALDRIIGLALEG